jgi:hypothetical protein
LVAGGLNEIVANPFPMTSATLRGALGGPTGVTVPGAVAEGPVPTAFTAATLHVYDVPFVRPDTITGLDVPVIETVPGLQVTR